MISIQSAQNLEIQIGERIKRRRKVLGYSPQNFAKMVGVSYQQLNKYETGQNRVSSSQLAVIAKLLHVDINYFFENSAGEGPDNVESLSFLPDKIINSQETMKLVKNYIAIPDVRMRHALVELTASITKYIIKRST